MPFECKKGGLTPIFLHYIMGFGAKNIIERMGKMKIQNTTALFLGLTEREASEGKKAWSALDYLVIGETASRRTFIDRENSALLAAARTVCSKWGQSFRFDGEISQRGDISFTALYPEENLERYLLDDET